MFAAIETLEQLSAADVRALHPETSFPPEFGRECLEPFGIVPVELDPMPVLADGETLEPGEFRREGTRVFRGWQIIAAAAPAAMDVDAERDRRISAGFEFGGVRYQSRLPSAERAGDWEVFSGKALEALLAIMGGAEPGDLRWADAEADFAWIAADNSRVAMDAHTVIELAKAASAHRSRQTFAGSDLKAQAPIPADYTAEKYWPQ